MGITPEERLLRAAKYGRTAEVGALLSHGVDINATDDSNYTALLWATANNHEDIVRLLVTAGANFNIASEGETPLFVAVWEAKVSIARHLLASGANPNAEVNDQSLIVWASQRASFELVDLLVVYGANVNDASNRHDTPLMCAASAGGEEALHLLLRHRAEAHRSNTSGGTALSDASDVDDWPVVELLLTHCVSMTLPL